MMTMTEDDPTSYQGEGIRKTIPILQILLREKNDMH